MKLSNNRYEEIKEIVVRMFEAYEIRSIPISGFEIANRMGIRVIPYSAFPPSKRLLAFQQSHDAFCAFDNSEWRISYNDNQDIPYGRVNFGLLHEIGHVTLNHTEDSALAETEADFFAKFAQCPPVLVHKLGLNNAFDIMNRFDISFEAARYALEYYHKWQRYGGTVYKDYEIRTCHLFGFAV